MPPLPHCFVISIDKDGGIRLESALTQLDAIGASYSFIAGYTPEDPEIDRSYSRELNRVSMKRPLSRGEIAAYLSHRRALTAFLETGAEFAIIMEDDFGAIDPANFHDQISRLLQAPLQWDLVKLFDYQLRKKPRARLNLGTVDLVEYPSPTAGMVAYLVRRSGAKKLTRRPLLFRPIDEDIKFYWEIGIYVFSVVPNLVSELSEKLGGSIIEPERFLIRSQRSPWRALRGNLIELKRRWMHLRNRRRFGIKAAIKNAAPT